MSKKNILLCLDAFGTLFKPRQPIAQQYGEVARQLGIVNATDDAVEALFRKAFKAEAKEHPNYGKAVGMNAETWWTNIIDNTFRPLLQPSAELPKDLAPRLIHRFWSDEGYTLFPDVASFLRNLPGRSRTNNDRGLTDQANVVVGVITNSDDRVPFVLESLGLNVSWLRHNNMRTSRAQDRALRGGHDIDFVVLSYDVGHEKPDQRIFGAAEDLLKSMLPIDDGADPSRTKLEDWTRVFVGDEYDKDVVGALNAGWNAVLIDRDKPGDDKRVRWPSRTGDGRPEHSIQDLFESGSEAVGFDSLESLGNWLPKKQ